MFDWFGESPAPGVQWLDIILSFVAFGIAIVALPTIFEMFWAQPLARADFDRVVDEEDRMLLVFLKNPPITNRVLRALRVRRRTVASLTVAFRVIEAGTNREVAHMRHATLYSDEEKEPVERQRIALPPTYSVGASFGVVRWDKETKQALVLSDNLRSETVLLSGRFVADIKLMVDGEPQEHAREFIVGDRSDDLVWIKPKGG